MQPATVRRPGAKAYDLGHVSVLTYLPRLVAETLTVVSAVARVHDQDTSRSSSTMYRTR